MPAAITAIGRALPERIVTNSEIGARLGVDPEWIESRTGIKERRWAAHNESSSTLGAAAARAALANRGLGGGDVDLIIVATATPDYQFPSTACVIQNELGAPAAAFDVGAACSGFIYSLAVASKMIEGGMSERALVIGVEVLSRFIHLEDAVTSPLFGDGAGAAVVENVASASPMRFELGSDGSGAEHIIIPAGGSRIPTTAETVANHQHCIRMAGREVYRSAVRAMSKLGASLGADGFDLLIAHQANRRIIEEAAAALGVPDEKVFMNIERYGNTSAASIPIAISEAVEVGKLKDDDRLLLLAFGAGFTWGGAALDWSLARDLGTGREAVAAGVRQ